MGGKEFTALVKPTQNGVMFTTALGQSEVKRQSLREVCEKLLTLCNEPQRKDVGI
jgi:hypothetical protein